MTIEGKTESMTDMKMKIEVLRIEDTRKSIVTIKAIDITMKKINMISIKKLITKIKAIRIMILNSKANLIRRRNIMILYNHQLLALMKGQES